jgi:hypothetical protein
VSAAIPALPGVQIAHLQSGDGWSTVGVVGVVAVILAFAGACTGLFALGVRRARRRGVEIDDECSARAAMDELCPHGWQAQITMYGSSAPAPADAPAAHRPRVSLDWAELSDGPLGPGRVAVVRRVWAPTITTALARMVEDRCTDATLEEIERAGKADEQDWS